MRHTAKMEFLVALDNPVFVIDHQFEICFNNPAALELRQQMGIPPKIRMLHHLFPIDSNTQFPHEVTVILIDGTALTLTLNRYTIEGMEVLCGQYQYSRLQREREFRQLNEELFDLRAVFEHSYDGIFVVDGQGYGRRINKSYARVTGLDDAQKMVGMHMSEVIAAGFVSESVSLRVLNEGQCISIQPKIRTKAPVLMTGVPVFDEDGKISRVITNVRDISELIKLHHEIEEAKQTSERYYTELMHLRSQNIDDPDFIAASPAMLKVTESAMKLAKIDVSILITGASGVGKGILARLIHRHSVRAKDPFITINCGAIPENLIESELFGYESGAFTNASNQGKPGLFELAKKGTLFLDEIGELPLSLQVKLLGVLQERRFMRLGGVKECVLDARIISATNQNLEEMVRNRTFRKDLFYRLFIAHITIPELRQRKEDIFALVIHCQRKFNQKYAKTVTLTQESIDHLIAYDWPGNIRQLTTTMEQIIALAETHVVTVKMLPRFLRSNIMPRALEAPPACLSLQSLMDETERTIFNKYIAANLSSYRIAELLDISQSTAIRKIQKYRSEANRPPLSESESPHP